MPKNVPCALAIGGLDPGGGAGVLADARAFARAGAFATAVVSVWTEQSTSGLRAVRVQPWREVERAIARVLGDQRVRAIKTGALGDVAVVAGLARMLGDVKSVPVVIDPVVRATRGKGARALLEAKALGVLRETLLPCATLVTPNADEARAITGLRIGSPREAREAARAILAMGARAVLLKGGHVAGELVHDVFVTQGVERSWRRRRMALPPIHGGGCTLAALIAGRLAMRRGDRVSDRDLVDAVSWARGVHGRALRSAVDVGGAMRVLMP